MKNATKAKFNSLRKKAIEVYTGGDTETSPGEEYSVEPSVQQTLESKIVENADPFYAEINVLPVDELKGEKILGGVGVLVASRTDTSGAGERNAVELGTLDNKGYELFQVNSDVAISYKKLDTWAKFPNFAQLYAQWVQQAISNDRLRVGWYGVQAAPTTDRVNNPNGEDVNKGWLQLLREDAPAQVNSSGVTVGEGGTFVNLDKLVSNAKRMIPKHMRNNLVALVSDDLLGNAEGKYYEDQGGTPSEKEKIRVAANTYGGLPAICPPFFPDGTVLVIPLANLSIYWQQSSARRAQKDRPEKNRAEDFQSRNEGYVVEEYEQAALIENITEHV